MMRSGRTKAGGVGNRWLTQRGQAFLEYLVIAGVIAAAVIAFSVPFRANMDTVLQTEANSKVVNATDSDCNGAADPRACQDDVAELVREGVATTRQ